MKNNSYNPSIDIFKFFCAIMIVDSHVRLINYDKSFLFEFFRLALYFFHISFGYYYMKGLTKNNSSIANKNIKRLITPLLFWIIIYLLLNIYNNVLSGYTLINDFINLQLRSLFINGVGFHLWFMAALIIYVIIASLLYKVNKHKILYYLIFPLYIVGLLGSYYYGVGKNIYLLNAFYEAKYFTTYCRLFLHGLPLFALGMYLSENEERFNKIKNNRLILGILIGLAISTIEILYVLNNTNIHTNICSLGLFILTIPLFIYLKNNRNERLISTGKTMKYLSTFMYFSHPLIRTVFASLFMRILGFEADLLFLSILTVVACSISGLIFYKIDNRYLNKVLS